MKHLPKLYKKKIKPYTPPEPVKGLNVNPVDSFTLGHKYDPIVEDQPLESKGPNDVLYNVEIGNKDTGYA